MLQRMTDASSPPADAALRAALEGVYREFAAPTPAKIEGCPCCISTRGVDVLLTTPLREITGRALGRYVSGAFLTVGGEGDFRYLLPRILEVSANDPGQANGPEIVLGRLRLANWRSWPARQQAAVEQFMGAWFDSALEQDLADARDGWIGMETESVLCGMALAGLPISRWLARLHEPSAQPVLADLRDRYPRHLSGFWKDAPAGFKELSRSLTSREA